MATGTAALHRRASLLQTLRAALFWDESNWDPMCEAHHNAKSRAERKAETSQKTPVENI